MKLISLNVERHRHLEKVYPFLEKEGADVVCLQEGSAQHLERLEAMGYYTAFLPCSIQRISNETFTDGIIVASRIAFTHTKQYYYKKGSEVPEETYDAKTQRGGGHQGFLLAEIPVDDTTFHIATTHFTWTPDGSTPSLAQREDMESFLGLIAGLPPHIMCGDFNIPRYHNSLYEKLTPIYEDNIPKTYDSSLDKSLHRHGENEEKQNLFSDYMVDYVFSQKPYVVSDVRLTFGISDHAAVIATIEKG